MANPVTTFLQAVQTAVALIQNGSNDAFNWIPIVPATGDVIQRLRAPGARFPACVLHDEGGATHPHNKKLKRMRFSATVAVRNLRQASGEQASEQTLDLAELLLTGDGTNPGQKLQFGTGTPVAARTEAESATVGAIGANEIIYRTMYFDYTLQTS